jgi:CheY-like chemotaxis protein
MEAVGQLTGGIAHDFNNLLTVIQGSIELVMRRANRLDPETTRLLGLAISAGERGAALTHRLLAFSRQQSLSPQHIDINRHVSGISDLLRRTLGEAIAIETVLAGGLWHCFVDPNQLESALLNIAVNARDAMPDGGKLTVETGNTYLDEEYAAMHEDVSPGPYVLLAVTDTGTGMSPEVMSHALELFFTTKESGKGTGLGLSQVYGFVKQSGGHIKLYSERGLGTTVKVYLPRSTPEAMTEPVPDRSASILPGNGETVLLVEDDAQVREFSASALRHLGYCVLEASEASAALNILAEHSEIALLLTDVGLPDLNGRQLAEEARRRVPRLKVVYMTGYARNAIVHHGVLDAGVDLLAKPFTTEGLGRKLQEVLRRD